MKIQRDTNFIAADSHAAVLPSSIRQHTQSNKFFIAVTALRGRVVLSIVFRQTRGGNEGLFGRD